MSYFRDVLPPIHPFGEGCRVVRARRHPTYEVRLIGTTSPRVVDVATRGRCHGGRRRSRSVSGLCRSAAAVPRGTVYQPTREKTGRAFRCPSGVPSPWAAHNDSQELRRRSSGLRSFRQRAPVRGRGYGIRSRSQPKTFSPNDPSKTRLSQLLRVDKAGLLGAAPGPTCPEDCPREVKGVHTIGT